MLPYSITWLEAGKEDIRALDRPTAMCMFEGILRFARSGEGDIPALQGDLAGAFRLRLGNYRVLFSLEEGSISIFGVRHRSRAYRS